MQNFAIPTSIWINFGLLVAAAVFVGVKLAATDKPKPSRKKDGLIGKAGAA